MDDYDDDDMNHAELDDNFSWFISSEDEVGPQHDFNMI